MFFLFACVWALSATVNEWMTESFIKLNDDSQTKLKQIVNSNTDAFTQERNTNEATLTEQKQTK